MRINRAWAAMAPVGVVIIAVMLSSTGPIANNDYGLHLRIGQEIAENGKIPRHDNHSYTLPKAPYPAHEWLIQGLLYRLHKACGNSGLVVLKGLLTGLTLIFLMLSIRGPLVIKLSLIIMIWLLGWNHIYIRPHLFSWMLASLLVLFLNRRIYWALPLLLLLWANSHGSILLGVGIIGIHFLKEQQSKQSYRPMIWIGLCMLVPLLNPLGIGIYTIFFQISAHTGFIGEWKSYALNTVAFWVLTGLFTLAGYGWFKSQEKNPYDLILIGVLALLSFSSSRNGIMAAIFLTPFLDQWYTPLLSRGEPRARKIQAWGFVILALALLGLRLNNGQVLSFRLDYERLPIAAVQFMKKHRLPGPVFNDYNFGGYFLWKAWPDYPVFIDGRTEVYQGRVLKEYLTVSRAQAGWERIMRKYDIKVMVIRPEREIAKVLLQHEAWDLVYFDYNSVIFIRSDILPELRRLHVISPYGHRDSSQVRQATEEINYMVQENPVFFGGYKILAFLLYRQGNLAGARQAIGQYLKLHPQGRRNPEARSLLRALQRR